MLARDTVLSLDYSHYRGNKGWRTLNINPLLPDPNNPAGARIRPLAADLQRVYGDPRLLGITNIIASVNDSLYDEAICQHREALLGDDGRARRATCWHLREEWAAQTDGSARRASPSPQTPLGHRRRHLRAVGMGLTRRSTNGIA